MTKEEFIEKAKLISRTNLVLNSIKTKKEQIKDANRILKVATVLKPLLTETYKELQNQ